MYVFQSIAKIIQTTIWGIEGYLLWMTEGEKKKREREHNAYFPSCLHKRKDVQEPHNKAWTVEAQAAAAVFIG